MLLWGTLAGQERDLLQVDLQDVGHDVALAPLVGAMCDVRTILAGQLCLFSTFIVDIAEQGVPQRVVLAVPEAIQVANRRRFARHTPLEPVPVRFSVPAAQPPFVAILSNIGANGLGCRVVSGDLDSVVFIGDEVQLEFALPWSNEVYTLPGVVCAKTPCREEGHVLVGFEFAPSGHEATLDRLRAALEDEGARLTEKEEGAS